MREHPRTVNIQACMERQRFSAYHWKILMLTFLVMAADGFDNAAIGYVAPVLARVWGVERGALGQVMAATLIGTGIGSLIGGPLVDRYGRKKILVLAVALFGMFDFATAYSHSVEGMILLRFITGLGLGAAIPAAITIMSEFSPIRVRGIVVNTMICGFSVGMVAGGAAAASLIPEFGWTSVLIAGGLGPIALAFGLIVLLPESVQFMAGRPAMRHRIVKVLGRIAPRENFDDCDFVIGQSHGEPAGKEGLLVVLSLRYLPTTLLLWVAYFTALVAYYFLTNWMPTLMRDAGLDVRHTSLISTLFPLGGVAGTLLTGWIMNRFSANRTLTIAYLLAAALVFIAGRSFTNSPMLFGVAIFLSGMVLTGANTSTSAYTACIYPASVRGSGVSWLLGIGRLGGMAGAFVGGILLSLGWQPATVFSLLAVPTIVAGTALYALGRTSGGDNGELDDDELSRAGSAH